MADDDMADYLSDDEDFGWFYVEDTCPLADELAETAIPDPGYAGTNAELDMTWYDFDLFDYWDDLEYGLDPYWDDAVTPATGEKRKRSTTKKQSPGKRRKVELRDTARDGSVFMSMDERRKLWDRRAPVVSDLKVFALLPRWRERCAEADGVPVVKSMPKEMKQAAEAKDEESPEGPRQYDAMPAEGDEDDWEDEDEGGDDEDEEVPDEVLGPLVANVGIDLEALKTVLRNRLGEVGLDGLGEEAVMAVIMKMVSGEEGADEATGDLASTLLGALRQGGDSGASGWLAQQGVSLDEGGEEEEDDASSIATVELPESSKGKGKGSAMQISPTDSAIEMVNGRKSVQMALRDGSPQASKKRSASSVVDDGTVQGGKKRKRVAFVEVPVSSKSADSSLDDGDEAPAVLGNVEAVDEATKQIDQEVEPSEDLGAPNLGAANTRSAKTLAAPAKTTASKTTARSKAKESNTKAEAAAEAAAPAKTTRKRKADAVEDEPPPAKKATRAKTPAASSAKGKDDGAPSYARATRATRARSGK